jgi:hypothetical protein
MWELLWDVVRLNAVEMIAVHALVHPADSGGRVRLRSKRRCPKRRHKIDAFPNTMLSL